MVTVRYLVGSGGLIMGDDGLLHQCRGQLLLDDLSLLYLLLQGIAEGHEFIDSGDDAINFNFWEWELATFSDLLAELFFAQCQLLSWRHNRKRTLKPVRA